MNDVTPDWAVPHWQQICAALDRMAGDGVLSVLRDLKTGRLDIGVTPLEDLAEDLRRKVESLRADREPGTVCRTIEFRCSDGSAALVDMVMTKGRG